MDFLEKDLEEIIYLSDKDALSDKGLYLKGVLKRQLKIGNYGIADLVNIEKPYYSRSVKIDNKYHVVHNKGTIEVIELKKDKIGVSTFFQALNYVKGIKSFLEERNCEYLFNFKIILIGKSVDLNGSFCYLSDLFNMQTDNSYIEQECVTSVDLYTYSYNLDGIKFKQIHGYNLINKGF
jgi:hypothetical protein